MPYFCNPKCSISLHKFCGAGFVDGIFGISAVGAAVYRNIQCGGSRIINRWRQRNIRQCPETGAVAVPCAVCVGGMCPCIVMRAGGQTGKGYRIGACSKCAGIACVGYIGITNNLIRIGIGVNNSTTVGGISAVGGGDVSVSRSRRTGNVGYSNVGQSEI